MKSSILEQTRATILSCFLGAVTFLAAPAMAGENQSTPGTLTTEGLEKLQDTRMDAVYMRPGLDLKKYYSIIIGDIGVHNQRDPGSFQLSLEQRREISGMFRNSLERKIKDIRVFTLTDTPSRETLKLDIVFLDADVHFDEEDAEKAGENPSDASGYFMQSSGSLTISGVLTDSASGKVLARIKDKREEQHPSIDHMNAVKLRQDFWHSLGVWSDYVSEGLLDLTK
jgi:hypothetical protein